MSQCQCIWGFPRQGIYIPMFHCQIDRWYCSLLCWYHIWHCLTSVLTHQQLDMVSRGTDQFPLWFPYSLQHQCNVIHPKVPCCIQHLDWEDLWDYLCLCHQPPEQSSLELGRSTWSAISRSLSSTTFIEELRLILILILCMNSNNFGLMAGTCNTLFMQSTQLESGLHVL